MTKPLPKSLVSDAELEGLRAKVEQLQTALETRVVIEQAKGILAERYDLSVDDAFSLLRSATRTARMRVHELAAAVVDSGGASPAAIVIALARRPEGRATAQREHAAASRERAAAQRSQAAVMLSKLSSGIRP